MREQGSIDYDTNEIRIISRKELLDRIIRGQGKKPVFRRKDYIV